MMGVGWWLASSVLAVEPIAWQLATEATWNDNVTNAERPEDLLAALVSRTELAANVQRVLEGGHRLSATAAVGSDIWPQYERLNLVTTGLAGAWSYKFGFGSQAPVLLAQVSGHWAGAYERTRSGLGGSGLLQVQQRASTDWVLVAGHEWRRFDAQGRAFDSTAREWFGRVEWTLSENWFVIAEGRLRQGDVVSYSLPPRPDLEKIGKPLTFVNTFNQATPWLAYYFPAETRSGSLELQRAFGRSGLILRHEIRRTLHAGPGYDNRLTTLRFPRSF